jgi:hypothetical protein
MKIPTNMKTPIASFVSSDASGSSSSDAIPLTGPSTPRSAAVRSDSTSLTARVSTALRSAMPGRAGASFVTPDTGRQIDRPRGSAVVQTPRTSETPAHHVGKLVDSLINPKKYSDVEWAAAVVELLSPNPAIVADGLPDTADMSESPLPRLAGTIERVVGQLSEDECRTALRTLSSIPALYSTEGSQLTVNLDHRQKFVEVGSLLKTALEVRVGPSDGAAASSPAQVPDHLDGAFDVFFEHCGGPNGYNGALDQFIIEQGLRRSGFG